MEMQREISGLEQLLDRIAQSAGEQENVSLKMILETVGRRSFGPLLLVAGLVTLAPFVGDIPGVPTLMGFFVFVTAVQLLTGREKFWLPGWMLKRSVSSDKLRKANERMRPAARFLDRWTGPRLTILTQGAGLYAVACACIVIALSMPPMEFIPFSANAAGFALTALGLALIAHDGVLALAALAVTVGAYALILYHLFT